MTRFLRTSLFVLTLGGGILASCSDDSLPIDNPGIATNARYELDMYDSEDSLSLSFDGFSQNVTSIVSPFETWLKIAQDGQDGLGNTRISLTRLASTPSSFEQDSAYIYLEDNKIVKLVVSKTPTLVPLGENSSIYDVFNKQWWKEDTIMYHNTVKKSSHMVTEGENLMLPWATFTKSNIPTEIFENDALSSDNGWEMAYNLFAAQTTKGDPMSFPYFMLYNKYTGTLRVFYFQPKDAGTGGEVSFIVTPSSTTSPKYPYYSSLQYGIPACNENIHKKANVLKITNSTFQQQITPYLKSDKTLKEGWYCFDVDWSAYKPGVTPFLPTDIFSVDCKTAEKSNITLYGNITGKMEGTYELENTSTSASGGTNLLSCLFEQRSNIKKAVTSALEGKYLDALDKGVGTLYSLGSSFLDWVEEDGKYPDDEIVENTRAIKQDFTGQIDLTGYSIASTSNNSTSLQFNYNSFAQSEHAGKGVWGLQDNPVVYVVGDRLMGDDEDLSCFVYDDSYGMGATDPFDDNHLRLMTFFDPTSIKFNINTDVFKNIKNATMTWSYGVYPNQTAGHTDVYRKSLLDLTVDEPTFIDHTANSGKKYTSFGTSFANMTYFEYPIEDMKPTQLNDTTTAHYFAQKDANYKYYGYAGNDEAYSSEDFFVFDPIVFLPTTFVKEEPKEGQEASEYGVGTLYDFQAPDFVVSVILAFEYTNDQGKLCKALFSKRFVPQVKSITTDQMLSKTTELEKYVKNGVHQTIGNFTIKSVNADKLLQQFFNTSSYIRKYKDE